MDGKDLIRMWDYLKSRDQLIINQSILVIDRKTFKHWNKSDAGRGKIINYLILKGLDDTELDEFFDGDLWRSIQPCLAQNFKIIIGS